MGAGDSSSTDDLDRHDPDSRQLPLVTCDGSNLAGGHAVVCKECREIARLGEFRLQAIDKGVGCRQRLDAERLEAFAGGRLKLDVVAQPVAGELDPRIGTSVHKPPVDADATTRLELNNPG
jgi:hypothetical protein